jgi:uncharacterized protein (DUF362 family)
LDSCFRFEERLLVKATRRDFLKALGAGLVMPTLGGVGAVLTQHGADALADSKVSGGDGASRSKLIIARHERFMGGDGRVNGGLVGKALDDGLMRLTGAKSPDKAWVSLFKPEDVVGLKLNCLAKKAFSPHVELVEAVIRGLKLAGVKEGNIIVFDRTSRELAGAGFTVSKGGGLKCFGTDELSGGGYESRPEIVGRVGSCFSKIISSLCTAIINVPVLKDHDLAGVSVAMKNFYGVIHNPNKYHDNNCDPYIAELYTHPYIRGKVRLTICDALIAQCNGGPAYKAQWAWPYNGILLGLDPVAMDRIGADIIEEKRRAMGLPSLKEAGREPKYIQTAASLGLGTDNPSMIRVIET